MKKLPLRGTVKEELSPRGEFSLELLMRQADIALYHAKSVGRGCYCVYRPGMKAEETA